MGNAKTSYSKMLQDKCFGKVTTWKTGLPTITERHTGNSIITAYDKAIQEAAVCIPAYQGWVFSFGIRAVFAAWGETTECLILWLFNVETGFNSASV